MTERMKFSSECKKFWNFYTLSFSAFFLKQCFASQISGLVLKIIHSDHFARVWPTKSWRMVCRMSFGAIPQLEPEGYCKGFGWRETPRHRCSGVDNVDVERDRDMIFVLNAQTRSERTKYIFLDKWLERAEKTYKYSWFCKRHHFLKRLKERRSP